MEGTDMEHIISLNPVGHREVTNKILEHMHSTEFFKAMSRDQAVVI